VQAQNGEQCDDGGNGNGDQCLDNCRWNVCGDGHTYVATLPAPNNGAPLEECDDGNDNNRDGCLSTCSLARCGDGFEQFMVEECDDGNEVDNDGCTNVCNEPACGDGILQEGEACDDGGTCQGGPLVGQGCNSDEDCPS